MSELAVKPSGAEVLENVIIKGDLAQLQPQERVTYYNEVCRSVGLNPFTKPFEYIKLNGKLTLYALKGATDQLRALHGVSIEAPKVDYADDLIIVSVVARDKTGRTDADTGAVTIGGLKGENKANAIMKAITKAKRRVTLSMCGLGMLDETEVETIPDARPVAVSDTGQVQDAEVRPVQAQPVQEPAKVPPTISPAAATRLRTKLKDLGVGYESETQFVEDAIGLSALETFGELTQEQAGAVWQHATSLAAKAETKPVYKTWTSDEQAQQWGAKSGAFSGGGHLLMLSWDAVRKEVGEPYLPTDLYPAWHAHVTTLLEGQKAKAA